MLWVTKPRWGEWAGADGSGLGGAVVSSEIWPPLRWWPLGQATNEGVLGRVGPPRNLQLGILMVRHVLCTGTEGSRPGGKGVEKGG